MTLIGTPANLIVSDTLVSAGYESLSFFSFLPVGIVTLVVGILFLLPATKMLTPKAKAKDSKNDSKSLKELVNEYGVAENLFRVHIKDHESKAIGQTVVDLNVYREYGINVLELRRSTGPNRFVRTVNQQLASPSLMLQQGDVLYLSGEPEKVQQLTEDFAIKLIDTFLNTEFEGGRHQKRIDKITEIENNQ